MSAFDPTQTIGGIALLPGINGLYLLNGLILCEPVNQVGTSHHRDEIVSVSCPMPAQCAAY